MLELFEQGGLMMYPLALSSVIAVIFIVERAFALRKRKIIIPEIISVVDNFSTEKDIEFAKNICARYDGALSNLIKIALDNHLAPKADIRELLEDQGRQDIRELERGLNILQTIGAIAPLMGLLGTVLGMIGVFAVIKTQGAGQTGSGRLKTG